MNSIIGEKTGAILFTDTADETTIEQVKLACNNEVFKDCKIRIMPDCHAGKGCVVGFTSTMTNKVVPNIVGVDIGCGMLTRSLGKVDIDFELLDKVIHEHIPSGFNVRETPHYNFKELEERLRYQMPFYIDGIDRVLNSIGTLGGGNHFIEVSEDDLGYKYLIVHTGSRNLGLQVCEFFQTLADNPCKETGFRIGKGYIRGKELEAYLSDMQFCLAYASLNRKHILDTICEKAGLAYNEGFDFETVHNFIGLDGIVRKGATSAYNGELLLIPINMRDGSLLCSGKGNPEWNYSAPHGAGRILSRSGAYKKLDLDQYEEDMKDVYSTTVGEKTLDESPRAYKPIQEIIDNIKDTVKIIKILKPLYNFKAEGNLKRYSKRTKLGEEK